MNRIFFKVAGALGAIMIAAPAIADEAPANPVKHVRHVERAPVRAAPAQAAPSTQSNWTGSQIGGQGGASSMAQARPRPWLEAQMIAVRPCSPRSMVVLPCLLRQAEATSIAR